MAINHFQIEIFGKKLTDKVRYAQLSVILK